MRLLLPVVRWSLTPPFHPYLIQLRHIRRSILCCAISQVALGGRYPPSCSMEPGSSSVILEISHHVDNRGHPEVSQSLYATTLSC